MKRWRWLLRLIPLVLLGYAGWRLEPWRVDLTKVIVWPILVGLVINFTVYLPVRVFRWRVALTNPPGLWRIYRAQIEGIAAGGVIGFGTQDVVRSARLNQGRLLANLGSTLAERASEILALAILAALAVVLTGASRWLLLAPAVVPVAYAGLVVFGHRLLPRVERWPQWHDGLSALLSASTPGTIARMTSLSLLGWGVETVILCLALHAFGLPADVSTGLVTLIGLNLAIAIPGPPAQIGTFEAGVVMALGLRGVAMEAALPFALGYHLMMALPVYVAGALSLMLGRPPEAAPVEGEE